MPDEVYPPNIDEWPLEVQQSWYAITSTKTELRALVRELIGADSRGGEELRRVELQRAVQLLTDQSATDESSQEAARRQFRQAIGVEPDGDRISLDELSRYMALVSEYSVN